MVIRDGRLSKSLYPKHFLKLGSEIRPDFFRILVFFFLDKMKDYLKNSQNFCLRWMKDVKKSGYLVVIFVRIQTFYPLKI